MRAWLIACGGLIACQASAPGVSAVQPSRSAETAAATMHFCAHTSRFDACAFDPSNTPAEAYALGQRRLASECQDQACLNEPIALFIGTGANFLGDPAVARALLGKMAEATAYARSRSAVSARATLAYMELLLAECFRTQAGNDAWLKGQRDEVLGGFDTQLSALAAQRDTLLGELAHEKSRLRSIAAAGERARTSLHTARADLAAMVTDFHTYKRTEASAIAQLRQLSERASLSALHEIAAIQQALVAFATAESSLPDALMLAAYRLAATLGYAQEGYAAALRLYAADMQKHGLVTPDLVAQACGVLANIIAYAQERRLRMLDHASALIAGLHDRADALVLLAADARTRDTIASANLLDASAAFLAQASERKQELWQLAPKSKPLNLQFLVEKHDRFVSFLQLETLCQSPEPWRAAGCNSLRADFSAVREFLQTSLAQQLRLNAMMLRMKGVAAPLVQAIDTELSSGRVRAAALANDAALRSAERS